MVLTETKAWTPETYLAWEREQERPHEYLDGEIIARSGKSIRHCMIVGDVALTLAEQLRGRPFEVVMNQLRTQVGDGSAYFYPDLVGMPNVPTLLDEHQDTLLDPVFIAEVLSPSTEAFDCGAKLERYREIPTLVDYLLIAQDRIYVEHFRRQSDARWVLTTHESGVLELPSLGCVLDLADVYDRARTLIDSAIGEGDAAKSDG